MNPAVPSGTTHSDLDPILVGLVDEFSRRVENGEAIGVEEFAVLHLAHAERLRALLPAIRGLAALGRSGTVGGAFSCDLREGSRLGDFRILRQVGRGGMGVVYEAFQASLGRPVALKVLSRRGGTDFLERFRREAQVVARLHHTNIVPVFGIGEDQGVHFYAMQFIQGHNLDGLLQGIRRGSAASTDQLLATAGGSTEDAANPVQEAAITGVVRWADFRAPGTLAYHRAVAAMGVQVAQGLAYAHGLGVLHRDVKPSNLLLDHTGIVRITDFGLAKVVGDDSLTNTGDVVGTLRYMAPERFEGRCTARSDVYSLGATLYELLTLRPAFDEPDRARLLDRIRNSVPPPPRALRPELPRDLETIVLKAIDPIPTARYQTAGELADDLQRYLENRPIAARPPSWWDRANKWARRRPGVAALGGALSVTLGILLIVWIGYSLNLRVALEDKHRQWEEAEKARAEAESGQYQALLRESQALRFTGQAGWRRQALANLKKLAHSTAVDRDVLALRNEAVACLTTPDLRFEASLKVPDAISIAFDSEGGKLAVLKSTREVVLLDMQTLQPLRTLPGDLSEPPNRPKAEKSLIQFHPSSRYLAFAAGTGVRIVPLDEGTMKARELVGDAEVLHLGFSRNGARLAVVREDGQVTLHEMPSGQPLRTTEVKGWKSKVAALNAEADRLVVADLQNDIVQYTLDQQAAPVVLGQHRETVTDLAFTPDGQQVMAMSEEGTVRLWNTEALKGRQPVAENWSIQAGSRYLALSPDGQFLVLVDPYPMGSLTLRETIGASNPLVTLLPDNADLFGFSAAVVFSPKGDRVIVGREPFRSTRVNDPRYLDIFRVEGKSEKRRLVGMAGLVRTLAFHPQRALAVTAQNSPATDLTFWDLEKCRPVRLWQDQSVGAATPLAFSPDGTLLATTLAGQPKVPESFGLREVETGAVRQRMPALNRVSFVTFSPSGKKLGVETPWMKPKGHLFQIVNNHDILALLPDWAPDLGRSIRFDGADRVVTLGVTGLVELYDPATGVKRQQLNLQPLYRPQLSADGGLLMGFNPERKQVLLYQFPEMRELAAMVFENVTDFSTPFRGRPFSVDNRYVITIGNLQAPQLRNGKTLELLCTFPSPNRFIADAQFSPQELLAILDVGPHSRVTLYDIHQIRRKLAELGLNWPDEGE